MSLLAVVNPAGIASEMAMTFLGAVFKRKTVRGYLPPPPKVLPAAEAAPPTKGSDVSLLSDVFRSGMGGTLGGILGNVIPGVGSASGRAIGELLQQHYTPKPTTAPSVSPVTTGVSGLLPALPALAGVAGTAVRLGVTGARTIARSAVTYCRRHPQWCASIGGTAAIAGLIEGGQLPPIKRRRARGISPSEFRGFRKVHKVLSGFCAPRMKIRRGAKCR